MEHHSDTIVAIILAMHTLGMHVFLSPEFREEDGMSLKFSFQFANLVWTVGAIMERVDTILRTGEIYLGHSCISNTFYQQREAVRWKRRSHEAKEEALAVAHYADSEESEEATAITDNQETDEITLAENYVSEEAQLEAYITDEDALLDYDVARGEAVEAELVLEELSLRCLSPEYMLSDVFERCACEGKYGLNDEGEIAYHDDDCRWWISPVRHFFLSWFISLNILVQYICIISSYIYKILSAVTPRLI